MSERGEMEGTHLLEVGIVDGLLGLVDGEHDGVDLLIDAILVRRDLARLVVNVLRHLLELLDRSFQHDEWVDSIRGRLGRGATAERKAGRLGSRTTDGLGRNGIRDATDVTFDDWKTQVTSHG